MIGGNIDGPDTVRPITNESAAFFTTVTISIDIVFSGSNPPAKKMSE